MVGSLDISGPPYRIDAADLVDRLWETRAAIEDEIEAHQAPGPSGPVADGPSIGDD